MKKSGISPLISAVLIVGFTVALGTVIYFWASNFIAERSQKSLAIAGAETSCLDVGFEVERGCTKGNNLELTVSNNKNNDIYNFIVRVENDEGGSKVVNIRQGVDGLEAEKLRDVSLDRLSGSLRASVIPTILVGNKEAQCNNQKVTFDLKQC